MAQMTWRTSDELLKQAKIAAARSGRSLNEFVTLVMRAATDPETAGSQVDIIRERLLSAGVTLVDYEPAHQIASVDDLAAAGARLATGTSVSELVSEGR